MYPYDVDAENRKPDNYPTEMSTDVTQLLIQLKDGDAEAMGELFEQVYDELRMVARAQLRKLRPGQTLDTTALVHEAYVKMCDQTRLNAGDRSHFLALSARAMRQILIDHFRRSQAAKRGGGQRPMSLDEAGQIGVDDRGQTLLDLDAALTRLESLNARLGRVVECRFFGGMSQAEIAAALDISERTVRSDWRKAKAFLSQNLSE